MSENNRVLGSPQEITQNPAEAFLLIKNLGEQSQEAECLKEKEEAMIGTKQRRFATTKPSTR